jgi:vanillate O-demethylase ferredoxin subunit
MSEAPVAWRSLLVASKTREAEDIVTIELIDSEGRQLAPFTAGAHVDIELSPGLVRQYSLCNSPRERRRYVIAVLRDPASQGGGTRLHDAMKPGDYVNVGVPRSRFDLADNASRHLLLAGGIGVAPILSMAERLHHLGELYEFHYVARSRRRAAFLMRTAELGARHYFDDEEGAGCLDLARLLSKPNPSTHLYVCGPTGFNDAVLAAATGNGWLEQNMHREDFAACVTRGAAVPFDVDIASAGVVAAPAAGSALDVVTNVGIRSPPPPAGRASS